MYGHEYIDEEGRAGSYNEKDAGAGAPEVMVGQDVKGNVGHQDFGEGLGHHPQFGHDHVGKDFGNLDAVGGQDDHLRV